MTIAQVSRQYGISADTLRYYERAGLIPPVGRGAGGIRDYREEDLRWVEFIQCMRSAGMPVETLARYVELVRQGEKTAQKRKSLLVEQRDKLVIQIQRLNEALEKLNGKIMRYDQQLLNTEKKLNGETD